ncbi:MAG TPA: 16S rRNA (guanine(527)-N(7))-methyltransferase RsmG [Thermoanaerobaculia bacterium]|nr:16S rRNA (guanine(527)-N(7))-methyltransferase RsmG [Thermoanaerobaculia bacterium]HQR66286.1 16S rRNA (guanine(527)-N(7))-methyltransferase RsmG [Thermoanaerobaculia bacterium]
MTAGEFERRIRAISRELPEASAAAVEREAPRLALFLRLLSAANERMNLVSAAAARPEELVGRHLLDALRGLPLLPGPRPAGPALLDIGSGGGFPAVPLLIVRGDLRGTLVESTRKKSRFLSEAVGELSLTAEVANARFPDSFPMTPPARFDLLTSRAVAEAGRLVRAARPLLRPGARALLWTTEALYAALVRDSRCGESSFRRSPGAESRGIALLGCFT